MIDRVRDLCRSAEETLARAGTTGVPPEEETRTRAHALELARQAVKLAEESLGLRTYPYLQAQVTYGLILSANGNAPQALVLFAQTQDLLQHLIPMDPEGAIHILGRLVIWYHEVGDQPQAQRLLAQLKTVTKSAYGADHPRYLLLEAQGDRWLTEGHARPFGLWHF